MYKSGDFITPGLKVLISAISIEKPTIGTLLAHDEKTDKFLVIEQKVAQGEKQLYWNRAVHTRSYSNALVKFAKKVDEEAHRYDRGEL